LTAPSAAAKWADFHGGAVPSVCAGRPPRGTKRDILPLLGTVRSAYNSAYKPPCSGAVLFLHRIEGHVDRTRPSPWARRRAASMLPFFADESSPAPNAGDGAETSRHHRQQHPCWNRKKALRRTKHRRGASNERKAPGAPTLGSLYRVIAVLLVLIAAVLAPRTLMPGRRCLIAGCSWWLESLPDSY
jgi:hypothetical protein